MASAKLVKTKMAKSTLDAGMSVSLEESPPLPRKRQRLAEGGEDVNAQLHEFWASGLDLGKAVLLVVVADRIARLAAGPGAARATCEPHAEPQSTILSS